MKAPNQLLGAPLGTDVQLECYVEAFPNTINYWVKNQRGTEDEMLLEGWAISLVIFLIQIIAHYNVTWDIKQR